MIDQLSPFEEDGFKSGFHIMPGLGIGVQFNKNQFFKYDGPVSSLRTYVQSLPQAIGEHLYDFDFRGSGGFNLHLRANGGKRIHNGNFRYISSRKHLQ